MGNSTGMLAKEAMSYYQVPPRYPYPGPQEVCLNIYDLSEDLILPNKFVFDFLRVGGAFHAGVEVWGKEWTYGVDGVMRGDPRWHEFHIYRETIHMGRTHLGPEEVVMLIGEMMELWRGVTYDFFQRNCCSFCNELCRRLGVGPIPDWVERLGKAFGKTLEALEEAARVFGMSSPRLALRQAMMAGMEDGEEANYMIEDVDDGAPWMRSVETNIVGKQALKVAGTDIEIPDEILDAAAIWIRNQRWRQENPLRDYYPPGHGHAAEKKWQQKRQSQKLDISQHHQAQLQQRIQEQQRVEGPLSRALSARATTQGDQKIQDEFWSTPPATRSCQTERAGGPVDSGVARLLRDEEVLTANAATAGKSCLRSASFVAVPMSNNSVPTKMASWAEPLRPYASPLQPTSSFEADSDRGSSFANLQEICCSRTTAPPRTLSARGAEPERACAGWSTAAWVPNRTVGAGVCAVAAKQPTSVIPNGWQRAVSL